MNISKVTKIIQSDTRSLCRRIFSIPSPVRDLSVFLFSQVLANGRTTNGTLIDRVTKPVIPPLIALFDPKTEWWRGCRPEPDRASGVVDSLRYLLHHKGYNNPHGEWRRLASLLVGAF